MSIPLLRGQEQISAKRPMPTDDVGTSSQSSVTSSATVPLYYYNATVRTIDAGQAIGVVVDFVLAHRNIYNSLGVNIASAKDTSLAYTCLGLTEELEWEANPKIAALWESLDHQTPATVVAAIGALLSPGQFIIDYRWGYGIGKKATTAHEMTSVTYNVVKTEVGSVAIDEFPAAAAITDSFANPTTTSVMGMNMIWNGATWDRLTSSDLGGSAPAGGGVYSTEQGDFTATITNATNNIVLSTDSLGGTTLTAAHFANGILKVIKTSDNSVVTIAMDDIDWTSATKTLDTSGCTNAFTFATGDIVSLTLLSSRIQDNRGADAKKGIEQAPIYTHNIGDTLAEVTNETNATNNYYLDVTGYDQAYFDFEGVAGTDTITLTLEASAQDDGTVDSSCSYTDISQYGISPTTQAAGAASYTADLSAVIDCKGMKFIKFKTVSSGDADDGDYNLRARRAY